LPKNFKTGLGISVPAYGPVAQGIEQQPSKLKVAGSNPAGVAIKIDEAPRIAVGIAKGAGFTEAATV
jgi:hypothetical protein